MGRHLYIAADANGAVGYVGIGTESRPWEKHTAEADRVIRSGEVHISAQAFTTTTDAEMAEALLIRALHIAQQGGVSLTNVAKREKSRFVVPAMKYRRGVVKHSDLHNAVIVKVTPGQVGSRVGIYDAGYGNGDSDLTVRCCRWWKFGALTESDRRTRVKHLVAVTAGVKPARIVGVWKTKPVDDWFYEDQAQHRSNAQRYRSSGEPWNAPLRPGSGKFHRGWVATVESPNPDAPMSRKKFRGMVLDWEGYNPQTVGYSPDLRPR